MSIVRRKKDGRMSHPSYWLYKAMVKRCNNANRLEYVYYGARGISVCDRWLGIDGFDNFVADMGNRPEGYSLDRIDNGGNYEPSNCKWSTATEQSHNQRISKANTSGYRGVCWDSRSGKWRTRIKVDKAEKYLGQYDDIKDAVTARLKGELLYWGKVMQ